MVGRGKPYILQQNARILQQNARLGPYRGVAGQAAQEQEGVLRIAQNVGATAGLHAASGNASASAISATRTCGKLNA